MFSKARNKTYKFWQCAGAGIVVAIVVLAGSFSSAQNLEEQREKTAQELEQLQKDISLTEQRKIELADEINRLAKDRATINRKLIETSGNTREIEKRISNSELRLVRLRSEQAQVRNYLGSKKKLLAEILGALQRMGRKPPPALLVTPEDALSSVRSAILLGAVVPEVRSETEILISQLKELTRLSGEIDSQRAELKTDLEGLAQEEERLNLLLVEKRRLAGKTQAELAAESAKAAQLAAKATSMSELINSLEREIESAQKAAEAARLAEIERKRVEEGRLAAIEKLDEDTPFRDPGRTSPAIAFSDAKGFLPLPVSGNMLAGFGDDDGTGNPTNGISIETRENSRISSPTDGWIIYAGPFRSYGQLLIINAGQGYHIVLSGMEQVNVRPGQFVLVGEPLGTMGSRRIASAGLVDVSTTKPILYVEFRKDKKSIDPAPWWSGNNLERASNDS